MLETAHQFPVTRDWTVINDDVMGGSSRATVRATPGEAVFSGMLSPDNGGGFASVRTELAVPPSRGLKAAAIRVRGDGKTYQFLIRTAENSDGSSYRYSFATDRGQWQDIVMPLRDFWATYRGRQLSDVTPIESHEIRQLGFLIADGQFGAFHLEVADIILR